MPHIINHKRSNVDYSITNFSVADVILDRVRQIMNFKMSDGIGLILCGKYAGVERIINWFFPRDMSSINDLVIYLL